MILYQKQKIDNAIAYFASEYKRLKGFDPSQTWLYKFLALLDFRTLKKRGTPCLGLGYFAMQWGPVPIKMYREIQKGLKKHQIAIEGDKYLFVLTPEDPYSKALVLAKEEPDLDYFTDSELDEMDGILSECVEDEFKLKEFISKAHAEIRSWQVAWSKAQFANQGAMKMDYADEFENIFEKTEGELTPEEERFLCFRGTWEKEQEAAQPY